MINKIGIKENELQYYSTDALRYLITNDAVKLTDSKPKDYYLQSEQSKDGEVNPLDLTTSDITLYANAYEVNSDIAGSKKIFIYGTYNWKVEPKFAFTDKMSIGYPITNEWYLNTTWGQVLEHYSQNCNYSIGKWHCTDSFTPSDHDNGQGVAAEFDIWANANLRSGEIRQSVYTTKKSGTSNVLPRYGHSFLGFTPSVSVGKGGLVVEPSVNTETLDYTIKFSW